MKRILGSLPAPDASLMLVDLQLTHDVVVKW